MPSPGPPAAEKKTRFEKTEKEGRRTRAIRYSSSCGIKRGVHGKSELCCYCSAMSVCEITYLSRPSKLPSVFDGFNVFVSSYTTSPSASAAESRILVPSGLPKLMPNQSPRRSYLSSVLWMDMLIEMVPDTQDFTKRCLRPVTVSRS